MEDGILGELNCRLVVDFEPDLLGFAVAELGQHLSKPDPLTSSHDNNNNNVLQRSSREP